MEKNKALLKVRRQAALLPISVDFHHLAKDILGKRGFSNVDLIAHWPDVVGEQLADAVKPDKIVYPKGDRANGTLCVRVQSGAFAMILEHQKNIVLDRVNTFLGYTAVSNIKIQQDNQIKLKPKIAPKQEKTLTFEQEKTLQQQIDGIKDENLRQKIYQIGKQLFFK